MKIAIILHKKVHILCNTSYELNKSVSKTVKMHHWTVFVNYFIEYSNYKQSSITYFPMQSFFNVHLFLCKYLTHSILQSFTEGQKCFRGTDRGLHFCKETNKICKNALFLEFLAYLHFVAWLNGLQLELKLDLWNLLNLVV